MKIHPTILEKILLHAVEIQQIAAPTFEEAARRAFLQQFWSAMELLDIATDPTGNLYARLPGKAPSRPVILSAHLDTVFPSETMLTLRRTRGQITGPGIGDNSLGLAALAGIVWCLNDCKINLKDDLWLVANTCEEGLGDLAGMRSVVKRFGSSPKAYLILEGMGLGDIVHRGSAVRRYRIHCETAGGHSWSDFGSPSAIHELVKAANRLTQLDVPIEPHTTFNIGIIRGGQSINTIAPNAELELDLRSASASQLTGLDRQVHEIVERANQPGVKFWQETIGDRPAGELPPDHPLIALAARALEAQGVKPILCTSSTDANIPLSLGFPAITLGLTEGSGAHTDKETIRTAPLSRGLLSILELLVMLGES